MSEAERVGEKWKGIKAQRKIENLFDPCNHFNHSHSHSPQPPFALHKFTHKMSEAYAGKSDEQIIQEQVNSLASKDNYQTKDSYNPRRTVNEEESNVNESGLEEFAGADVSIGRTGQTGGGTSAQNIPPEEGGMDRSQVQGESSDRFEGVGGAEDKRREVSR